MFGKKKPNPLIEEIDKIFGDRVIEVNTIMSSNVVYLAPKQFIGVAKMCRGLVMKYYEFYDRLIAYGVIGPDNFLYKTEFEREVRQ